MFEKIVQVNSVFVEEAIFQFESMDLSSRLIFVIFLNYLRIVISSCFFIFIFH